MENERETVPNSARKLHENQRPFPNNSTASASGIVKANREYEPWMVVVRKRSGYKGSKYGPSQVGTSKHIWAATPQHSGYNLDWTEKSKNGWPKAQSPTRSRPIPEYSVCSGDDHAPTAQLTSNKDGRLLIPGPNSKVLFLAHK